MWLKAEDSQTGRDIYINMDVVIAVGIDPNDCGSIAFYTGHDRRVISVRGRCTDYSMQEKLIETIFKLLATGEYRMVSWDTVKEKAYGD